MLRTAACKLEGNTLKSPKRRLSLKPGTGNREMGTGKGEGEIPTGNGELGTGHL